MLPPLLLPAGAGRSAPPLGAAARPLRNAESAPPAPAPAPARPLAVSPLVVAAVAVPIERHGCPPRMIASPSAARSSTSQRRCTPAHTPSHSIHARSHALRRTYPHGRARLGHPFRSASVRARCVCSHQHPAPASRRLLYGTTLTTHHTAARRHWPGRRSHSSPNRRRNIRRRTRGTPTLWSPASTVESSLGGPQ